MEAHKDQKRYLCEWKDEDGTLVPAAFESVQSAGRRRFNLGNGTYVDVLLSHFPLLRRPGRWPTPRHAVAAAR
jgi:hypothetical protein